MTRNAALLALGCLIAMGGNAAAQIDGLYNGDFEIVGDPPDPDGPRGWRSFNFSRYRVVGDGLGPILVRSGVASIELASGDGPTNDFGGFTTDVFDPDDLVYFNPTYEWMGGPVTVSGWYAIPADQPLDGANAGLKLEFKREDLSIYQPFEALTINGHTNGEWVHFSMTVNDEDFGDFPPYPIMVAVLPIRFGSRFSTGTIFWDDIELVQGGCAEDCDGDGVCDPDETDCDGNGTPDDCEVLADCNANGTPDLCEAFCECDIALPLGTLNVFDFLQFQTYFGNGNLCADLAAPFGTLNVFDFLAFQTCFGNGC